MAGPYQQDGKKCAELFDFAFAPETPASKEVVWRGLPAGTNTQKPYLMDLLRIMPGNQRAAYARTRIYSDKAQPARLELGSDDGVKIWLDGKQILAHNYVGPLKEGMEKVDLKLNQGWNTLQLKVTQNDQGWAFCARLAKPDGATLDGIHIDTALGTMAAAAPVTSVEAAAKAVKPRAPAPSGPTPVHFRKTQLDAAFRSEGVAVADFNNDGKLDVATGTMLYLGPDWKPQPMLGAPKEYKPESYSQEFYCFPEDIDRDGWLDLIVVGFPGAKTRWLKNPGPAGGAWKEYLAIEKTGNESPDWLDVDKDGKKELVFISDRGMAFAQPGADPTEPWPIHVIASPKDPRPPHGLGVGDLNSDGRNDVLCPVGWWEAPADPTTVPWTFHKAKLGFEAAAQMCVCDVNGDGRADVISSAAHRYGLWWYEQTTEGWTPHEIDGSISQVHALHLADINGDGLLDIVTGKRFWAHMHNDEGIDDPAILTWFELKRIDGKVSYVRHDIDNNSGVGLHFRIVDINGDGLLDIVTSHKKGVYVFTQERAK